jgi:hypothetical protein
MSGVQIAKAVGLLLGLCVASTSALPALADVTERSLKRWHPGQGVTFKLRVHYDEHSRPEMIITDDFKLPPRVDSRLVSQIYEVRLLIPAWHGLHSLPPGASGRGQ